MEKNGIFNAASSFEIKRYYQDEPRSNGVYSRNNLPKKNKGWEMRHKP